MTKTRSRHVEAPSPEEVIDAFHQRRQEYEADLEGQGYTPDRIKYLSGREFGAIAARLALHGIDADELLGPEYPVIEEPRTRLAKWGRRVYELHGNDDVAHRRLPPGDRE
jgi:hypothetical protein